MALLQTSGQITSLQIGNAFGDTGQQGIASWYRGGTYVDDLIVNDGIPTSGAIDYADFYGSGGNNVDSLTFTCGTDGEGYGCHPGAAPGFGTWLSGNTSFGNSPAVVIDVVRYNVSTDYLYIGSVTDMVSEAAWANTGYDRFEGFEISRSGATYWYPTSGSNYYGYEFSVGFYFWIWGPSTTNPLSSTGSTYTVKKVDSQS